MPDDVSAERFSLDAARAFIGAFNDSILTMIPNMYEKMAWDPVKDFDPVSLVGTIERRWHSPTCARSS